MDCGSGRERCHGISISPSPSLSRVQLHLCLLRVRCADEDCRQSFFDPRFPLSMGYPVILIHDIPQVLSANFFPCSKQQEGKSAVNTTSLNTLYTPPDVI